MDTPIIDFALPTETAANDPVLERALFLAELDMIELTATIPAVEPLDEIRNVY